VTTALDLPKPFLTFNEAADYVVWSYISINVETGVVVDQPSAGSYLSVVRIERDVNLTGSLKDARRFPQHSARR